jgi:flagellar protein FlgJ
MDPIGIASDSASLNDLRRSASKDPKQAVRQAANEFEALFTRQLLKSMRDAMPKSGLFDGPGQKTYESMLDDQLARNVAGKKGGLGDMLAEHLSRYMSTDTEPTIALQSARRAPAAVANASQSAVSQSALRVGSDQRIALGDLPIALNRALAAAEASSTDNSVSRQSDFVSRLWPHAQLAEQETGVPAEFVIGQAALESGWGKGEMRHADGRPAHNLFGIKAGSNWQGNTVDVTTTEYIDGKKTKRVETFRAYGSYAESFRDWVGLMKGLPRYANVLSSSATPRQFSDGLQAAGYATDPKYSEKLSRVIEQAIAIRRSAG